MFDDLLAANARYAEDFDSGGLVAPAAKGFGLVTCIDSRIDPLALLGLGLGDAKVIRNAGGRVTPDALRSLILATHLLNVERIAVMHHAGCAMISSRADLAAKLEAAAGSSVDDLELWNIEDADGDLRADVEHVRACPLIADSVVVVGWRYDVDTGRIEQVVS